MVSERESYHHKQQYNGVDQPSIRISINMLTMVMEMVEPPQELVEAELDTEQRQHNSPPPCLLRKTTGGMVNDDGGLHGGLVGSF